MKEMDNDLFLDVIDHLLETESKIIDAFAVAEEALDG